MKTVALLTDFGLRDSYVGVIKGVILRINPRVRLVDISHQVPAQDVTRAAFLLRSAYRYFPGGTIFVAVVDPGVGGRRLPLIVNSRNFFFLGPDNGVLSPAAAADGIKKIVAVENKRYFLPNVSRTFHGRDIFAPAAAHLSLGKKLNTFGRVRPKLKELSLPQPKIGKRLLRGEVIYIDRFGNLITNIARDLFIRFTQKANFEIKVYPASGVRGTVITALVGSYQSVPAGAPLAVFGSFGFLELAVNRGSAQRSFGAQPGQTIEVVLR